MAKIEAGAGIREESQAAKKWQHGETQLKLGRVIKCLYKKEMTSYPKTVILQRKVTDWEE